MLFRSVSQSRYSRRAEKLKQESELLKESCKEEPKDVGLIQDLLALQKTKTLMLKKRGLQSDIDNRLNQYLEEVKEKEKQETVQKHMGQRHWLMYAPGCIQPIDIQKLDSLGIMRLANESSVLMCNVDKIVVKQLNPDAYASVMKEIRYHKKVERQKEARKQARAEISKKAQITRALKLLKSTGFEVNKKG